MAEHMLYPTEWPSHCIARLIQIGPGGLLERKDEAIKSTLTVLCFVAGKTLGDPDAEQVIGEWGSAELGTIALELRELINTFDADQEVPITGPLTNALIERLLAIVIPMLLEWLEDWLTLEEPT